MEINPRDKAMMDAVIEVTERHNAARSWLRWCVVGVVSVCIGLLVFVEIWPGWLKIVFAAISIVGFLLFLIFLSTTQIGKDIADGWGDN